MSEKKIETKTIKTAEPIEDQTSFPEVKQYPEAPAPAPQVPPAEVGVTVTDLSGRTNPIAMGDYVKLDEPVKGAIESPLQGKIATLDENSRAAFEKAVSMFNNPLPTGGVSYGKFEDFKAEVLKAFAHMGLNVKKHFS